MQTQTRKRRVVPILCVLIFLGVLVLCAVLLWSNVHRRGMEWRFPLQYEALIQQYSAERDLDPFLVKGLIFAESSFRSEAVSPVGARGLMQIMPNTAEWLAERMGVSYEPDDLFHPAYNIRMGTYYIRLLLNMFEHRDTALAAYNAGMGNVRAWLEDARYSDDGETLHTIPFPETRTYVERVNRYMEIYRDLYRVPALEGSTP